MNEEEYLTQIKHEERLEELQDRSEEELRIWIEDNRSSLESEFSEIFIDQFQEYCRDQFYKVGRE